MKIAVVGMGVTGRAVADALLRRGHEVVALDDRPSDAVAAWSETTGVPVHSPASDLPASAGALDAIVPAPGLPEHHPIFGVAAAQDIDIISEFDLAQRWDDRPVVAVTGTDGKTTVVTLIERMLSRAGITAAVVGNSDTPYIEAIDDVDTQVFVVEASSFRLGHSRRFRVDAAAWLNFGPDHLDAHNDLASYEQAKAAIWRDLGTDGVAVANRDDSVVVTHARSLNKSQVQTFGLDEPACEQAHGIADGWLVLGGQPLVAIADLRRSLPHDLANALAAGACATAMGADRNSIAAVVAEFDGLPNRVETVAVIDGVTYVNDSKATTPHAAATAIAAFDSVVLLAGGKNKGLAFDDMVALHDRIQAVVALGDAASDIEAAFGGHVPTTPAQSMEEAIALAAELATAGDVVLLSPACASFDWYRNYGERGEDFRRKVQALAAEVASQGSST